MNGGKLEEVGAKFLTWCWPRQEASYWNDLRGPFEGINHDIGVPCDAARAKPRFLNNAEEPWSGFSIASTTL